MIVCILCAALLAGCAHFAPDPNETAPLLVANVTRISEEYANINTDLSGKTLAKRGIVLAQTFEVLAASDAPPEVVSRCCRELASAAGPSNLVGGQVDDLTGVDGEPCLERLEAIHRRKTGAMFRVSLRLGAIVGGGSDEQITSLETYGSKLGMAFQVTDDLLDEMGDEDQVGKRTGKDAVRGKLTFPTMLGGVESRRRASVPCWHRASVTPSGTHSQPIP